ncbi:Thioredoxin reductase 2 [Acropora cervicornis]|uniref:Thioredoxin reductase 2 n=1 Tax=Acropora cervicornis TaxID=6130 RepID=A0AAD9QFE4_ACRCE|nr:Thioredoxin reductase 2 [Acropora cervicornis]
MERPSPGHNISLVTKHPHSRKLPNTFLNEKRNIRQDGSATFMNFLKHSIRLAHIRGHLTAFKAPSSKALSSYADPQDYDLVVIGAANYGKKVAVLDFVHPSTQGTVWGLGGTCVNVGCIPKKIMHQAALLGELLKDAQKYGWNVPEDRTFSWESLVLAVQNHVKSLNWGHRVQLHDKKVEYLNAKGSFLDPHTIKAVSNNGTERTLRAKNFVVAVGGRPRFPKEIPGAVEYGISSDDLFSLKESPGKTLVIGASCILKAYSTDTIVVSNKEKTTREAGNQMAGLVTDYMENHGTRFLKQCVPVRIDKGDNGLLHVTWKETVTGESHQEAFQTVLFAIGRDAETSELNLSQAGVEVHPQTKKIIGNNKEQTTVPHIYAIGDVLQDRPELTPVAIRAGKLLADRLFGDSNVTMDYDKVVCLREGDRCGLTYKTLSATVGIHPTCAEEVVKLHITKRSGEDPTVTGC